MSFIGNIRIGRNPSFTMVAIAATLLACALIAFAVLGQFTRKSRLVGLLVPTTGTLNVAATQAGTLTSVEVAEGDVVRAGQVLMTINTDRATKQGDAAELISRNLEQRRTALHTERLLAQSQAQQRHQAYADRIRSMSTEQRQAEADIEALQRRVEFARKSVDRYAQLAASGFVADIQAQQKQEDLIDLGSRLSSAQRNFTALQRDTEALRAESAATASALQTQLVQLNRNLAALEQEATENSSRGRLVVTAPQTGTVSAMTLYAGNSVQAGQTLATVLPLAKQEAGLVDKPATVGAALRAELYAPSRNVGFVQVGQTVWIRYAAYPHQKFGMGEGRIESVSRTPINPQDLPAGQAQALLAAAQSNEPMYRVSVALSRQEISTYGEYQRLKPGMTLEADVVQERRAIWEWMFEPVLSALGLSWKLVAPQ